MEGTDILSKSVVTDLDQTKSDFYVVGIGASAGGLEAVEQFFQQMPSDSGMAFCVIQHLSPQYKSFMPELLAKHTDMEICSAKQGMEVKPNTIYLIPPSNYITIQKNILQLSSFDSSTTVNFPIDVFFNSLALEKKEKSIGLILSGKGSDGTKGIKAIHECGGFVLAQKPKTAKYQDMPKNAIQSGFVDYVASPGEFPEYLIDYVSQKRLTIQSQSLRDIFALIKKKTGIDFSMYKQNSVLRRIERRVSMLQHTYDSLEEYKNYLIKNPDEINALRDELLIGVTHFFRDKEAFDALKQEVIVNIFEQKRKEDSREIRVWVAGCSTGQEAYTHAIMLKEYMEEIDEDYDVRIFATDIDRRAIKAAGQGIYPEEIITSLPSSYIPKYFDKVGKQYQVKKEIRRMIIFAPHNIAKDSPFVNIDIISCRNMMIYFQPELQRKILSLFHFALNTKGYLFLGASETIGKLTNLFSPINTKWKIYKSILNDQWNASNTFGIPSHLKKENHSKDLQLLSNSIEQQNLKSLEALYERVIDDYMPPCLIVNEDEELIMSSAKARPYLVVPKGKVNYNVLNMVPTKLSVAIGTALRKVRLEKKEVQYSDIEIEIGDTPYILSLTVRSIRKTKNQQNLYLIMIQEQSEKQEKQQMIKTIYYDHDHNLNQRLKDLEEELYYTQQNLQTTIEELETSNEELQSTNEELIAANEELQSTNEEMQSINDELMTVNEDNEYKIQELTELSNDLDNLLVSTNIATVFLDEDMRIKRYTSEVTKVINLMKVDIGRPIHHISHNLNYDRFMDDVREVMVTSQKVVKEVQSHDGKWYSMKVTPYRTNENLIKGIVITFVNVTHIKEVNDELKVSSFAIEQSPSTIVLANADGVIEFANTKFTNLMGIHPINLIGTKIQEFYKEEMQVPEFPSIWNRIINGEKWVGDLKYTNKHGKECWEYVSLTPIKNDEGKIIQVMRIGEDITDKKSTEDMLRKSEMLSALGQLAAGIAHEIRNPLTSLKGFLQLMKGTKEYKSEYVALMLSEFNRIETIISELLVLARPQFVKFEDVAIESVIKDVCMLLETQAIMNNVEIRTNFAKHLPMVKVIEKEIKQVAINLVKNSIEAMPDGGAIRINIDIEDEKNILLSFEDTGHGIPSDKLPKLGEPFYTTKEKGTGLGLMVSMKIIENHNGTIHYSSTVGEGTTVEIRLPYC